MDILRWLHSRSDQSTSIADYNTYLDMLFSILFPRWFIVVQYNDKPQHLWLLLTSRSIIGVPSIYKYIVILNFGPTKPNNESVGYFCRHDNVLSSIYVLPNVVANEFTWKYYQRISRRIERGWWIWGIQKVIFWLLKLTSGLLVRTMVIF